MIRVRERRGGDRRCVVCGEGDGFMATCLACHVPFHGECCERCPTIGCAESPRHLPFTVRAPKSCSCFFGRPCSRCRARWAAQAEARREELIGTAIKWFVIAVLVGVVAYAVL